MWCRCPILLLVARCFLLLGWCCLLFRSCGRYCFPAQFWVVVPFSCARSWCVLCASLPRQLSQSTERVFLAVSDGHVCRQQSKLAHTNESLFITEDTRPESRSTSTKTALGGSLSLSLCPVRSRKSSCTCGSLRSVSSRRRCGSSVPRAAMKMRHQFSKWQVQWFMLCDFSSSVGSVASSFTCGARSSIDKSGSCFFLSWSAGSTSSISSCNRFFGKTRSESTFKRVVRVAVPVSSGVQQSERALHSWKIRHRYPSLPSFWLRWLICGRLQPGH